VIVVVDDDVFEEEIQSTYRNSIRRNKYSKVSYLKLFDIQNVTYIKWFYISFEISILSFK